MIDWEQIFTNPADAIVFGLLIGAMAFCIFMATRKSNDQEK